jgi:hypothetical protein
MCCFMRVETRRSLPGAIDTGIVTTTQLPVFYRFFRVLMGQIADGVA